VIQWCVRCRAEFKFHTIWISNKLLTEQYFSEMPKQ
jgi:hypothetical protein